MEGVKRAGERGKWRADFSKFGGQSKKIFDRISLKVFFSGGGGGA